MLCGFGVVLLGWSLTAHAQPVSEPIAEDEVDTYLKLLGENLGQCDVGWLGRQFVPSARIRFVYADRRQKTFTRSRYIDYMQTHCNPLSFEKRQLTAMQITDAVGGGKWVQWTYWWGQRKGAAVSGPSTATISLENEAVLVKHGDTIQMAEAVWRIRELVPGAERVYLREAPRPFDEGRQKLNDGAAELNRWNEQFLHWLSGVFHKPAPAEDHDWN